MDPLCSAACTPPLCLLTASDVCRWLSSSCAKYNAALNEASARACLVFLEVLKGESVPVDGKHPMFRSLFPPRSLSLLEAVEHLNSVCTIDEPGHEGDLRRFLALALSSFLALTELQQMPYTKVANPLMLQVKTWSHVKYSLLNDAIRVKGYADEARVIRREYKRECWYHRVIPVPHSAFNKSLLWVGREHLEEFVQRTTRDVWQQRELDCAWKEVFGELPLPQQAKNPVDLERKRSRARRERTRLLEKYMDIELKRLDNERLKHAQEVEKEVTLRRMELDTQVRLAEVEARKLIKMRQMDVIDNLSMLATVADHVVAGR